MERLLLALNAMAIRSYHVEAAPARARLQSGCSSNGHILMCVHSHSLFLFIINIHLFFIANGSSCGKPTLAAGSSVSSQGLVIFCKHFT